MIRALKHTHIIAKNVLEHVRTCSTNNCDDDTSDTSKLIQDIKTKSEVEIMNMINEKMEEYKHLLMIQSPENEQMFTEINKIETRLRKVYGFTKGDDLTIFPEFKFDEPEIDDQLGTN